MKRYPSKKSKKNTRNIDSYAGKWVAFIDSNPIMLADKLEHLMQKIQKKHFPKEPSVMLIPRKDEGPYILFII